MTDERETVHVEGVPDRRGDTRQRAARRERGAHANVAALELARDDVGGLHGAHERARQDAIESADLLAQELRDARRLLAALRGQEAIFVRQPGRFVDGNTVADEEKLHRRRCYTGWDRPLRLAEKGTSTASSRW